MRHPHNNGGADAPRLAAAASGTCGLLDSSGAAVAPDAVVQTDECPGVTAEAFKKYEETGHGDSATTAVAVVENWQLSGLAKKINEAAASAESSAKSAMQDALDAGRLLIEAKKLIGHGQWEAWLRAHCTVAVRTAQAYMRLATKVPTLPGEEAQRVADLPVREAIRAITTSPIAPPSYGGTWRSEKRDANTQTAKVLRDSATAVRTVAKEIELFGANIGVKRRKIVATRKKLQAAIDVLDALLPDVEVVEELRQ